MNVLTVASKCFEKSLSDKWLCNGDYFVDKQ